MRARRVDANQAKVVRDLRRMGVTVAITSGVGNGFPDLVISGGHHTALVEIKDPNQPASQRRLTAEEELFHFSWPGRIGIAHTAEEALNLLTEGLMDTADKLQRAVELRKEAMRLEKSAFAERSLPEKWDIGMRVRFLRDQDWSWSSGSEATVVRLHDNCQHKRGEEYQVFWTKPDNDYAIYWTTPADVEWVRGW